MVDVTTATQPEQGHMNTYTNKVTGTTVAVEQIRTGFRSTTVFPARGRSGAETIIKNHYAWSGVEKWLKKIGAE